MHVQADMQAAREVGRDQRSDQFWTGLLGTGHAQLEAQNASDIALLGKGKRERKQVGSC